MVGFLFDEVNLSSGRRTVNCRDKTSRYRASLSRGRRILNFSKPPVGLWAIAMRFGWSAMNNQITFNRTQMTQIERIFADFIRI